MSTLAVFRSAVAGELGMDNSTGGDQTFLDKVINEGVSDFCMRTTCAVSSTSITLTAGTSDYNLSTSILRIIDCFVVTSGVPYWLEVSSLDGILAMRRTTTANVSPAQYYAVAGRLLMVYPTPATADTIVAYYVPRPVTLSASSDSPVEIPAEYHSAVEYYAFYRAATYSDDSTSQSGQQYLQRYEMLVKQYKKDVLLTANHRLPRASVRRNRSTIPFHDRSRYPSGV